MKELIVFTGYVVGSDGFNYRATVATTSFNRVAKIMSIPISQVKKNWCRCTDTKDISIALKNPEQNINGLV
jgi:hypothetical protein